MTLNIYGDSQQTLLIVDDEAINLQLLCTQFQDQYRVLVAKSGQQALQRVKDNAVDLVLLDICMADMDGYEVLRHLKNNPLTQDIPVIFITAKTDALDEMMGLQLGAVDYIGKPLQLPIVEARVRTHMTLKRKGELLERLASVDSLTEIYNRRHFDLTLDKELKRSQRSGEPISLLMIDIDYFKQYNDSAGHSAGDYCLQQIAILLNNLARRPGDILARYGGEEFCIIAPNVSINGARELAERCVQNIRDAKLTHPNNPKGNFVSISVGVACLYENQHAATAKDLIDQADKCLYQVKESTRDGWQASSVDL